MKFNIIISLDVYGQNTRLKKENYNDNTGCSEMSLQISTICMKTFSVFGGSYYMENRGLRRDGTLSLQCQCQFSDFVTGTSKVLFVPRKVSDWHPLQCNAIP
jgi:hypothetical protein